MQLTILGETGDERGAQLERLTARILEARGYKYVKTNSISTGGHEIDVRAAFEIPSVATVREVPVLCECKAHAAPLGTSDWLKFLGKVLTEQATSAPTVRGILIALTGVNGNVHGAYETLRSRGAAIELVTGSELATVILGLYPLCSMEAAVSYVRARTDDVPTDIRLVFHDSPRWFVQFADGSFVLLARTDPKPDVSQGLVTAVTAALGVMRLRDLNAEAALRARSRFAQVALLGLVVAHDGSLAKELLSERPLRAAPNESPLDDAEYAAAGEALVAEGLLRDADGSWSMLPTTSAEHRVALLALLAGEQATNIPFGTKKYTSLIDDELLSHVLRIQGQVDLNPAEREEALTLLRWSPSAVAWALSPDPMLTRRQNDAADHPQVRANGTRYFRLQLLRRAVSDFQQPGLYEFFFSRLGLTELDFVRVAKFKSTAQVELQVELPERLGIKRWSSEHGGGLVGVWMHSEVEEPWDLPSPPDGTCGADKR